MVNKMKKRHYYKLILFIAISLTFSLIACNTNKDKEVVLSSNVLEDLNNDKLDIMSLLQRGDDCLKANDFASAKAFYEKAVIKDKMNIDTYLIIKDKYLDVNRLDDAYYFVNLAIDNSVDKDNMTKILDNIKSKFTPITLSNTIAKSSAFNLPTTVDVSVNNTDTETCDVTWDTSANTNNLGVFCYNGFCNKYHRTVTYNLSIKEITYTNYENARFGFNIDYPTYFSNVTESQNGDGISCTAIDGSSFKVWSGYNINKFSVKESMDFTKLDNKNVISYEYVGSDFYTLSWEENGVIVYEYYLVGSNQISGFQLHYSKNDIEKYKDIITHIINSFTSSNTL
jgi:hypothetical protein